MVVLIDQELGWLNIDGGPDRSGFRLVKYIDGGPDRSGFRLVKY